MGFLPGNSFEFLRPSVDKLIVSCPLYWLVVLIAALMLGLPALRKIVKGIRGHDLHALVGRIALLLLAAVATTLIGRGQFTLDKAAQTLTSEKVGFLFIPHRRIVPLSDVSHATLQTTAGAQMFVVVFRNGARWSLSSYTSRAKTGDVPSQIHRF